MPSLVEELQCHALDTSVPLSDLLRKALVVARKLKLDGNWIELELEGYRGGDVPEYRKTIGQVVLHSRRTGRIPIVFDDSRLADIASLHEHRAPLGPLEKVASEGTDPFMIVDFSPEMQQLLSRPFPSFAGLPQLQIHRSSISLISEAVRNAILKWSLKLEEEGIVGDGLSFSDKERQKAEREAAVLQPINFIQIGMMIDSTIQQGGPAAFSSPQRSSN